MRLSFAARTSHVSMDEPSWIIDTGLTPGRVKVLEIGITLVTATASSFGIGRISGSIVNPVPEDFLLEDPDDVLASGVIKSITNWDSAPSGPSNYFRRVSLPATIGAGIIWSFPQGITIPTSSYLAIWNISSVSIADMYAVVEI